MVAATRKTPQKKIFSKLFVASCGQIGSNNVFQYLCSRKFFIEFEFFCLGVWMEEGKVR